MYCQGHEGGMCYLGRTTRTMLGGCSVRPILLFVDEQTAGFLKKCKLHNESVGGAFRRNL